ncbi:MAG: YncE family protein [Planctomycetota bacterium]
MLGLLVVLCLQTGLAATDTSPAAAKALSATPSPPAQNAPPPRRIEREGLAIEFVARPAGSKTTAVVELMEATQAEVHFKVTDAASGEPVSGLYPVVYMDIGEAWDMLHGGKDAAKGAPTSCKDRVQVYLQGIVGMRPLIDLNSYFVLVMNQDPTIAVIDPILGITGRTNLYAQMVLKRRGADWAKTEDEKRMFVSMPVADKVAVLDLERFTVTNNLRAGDNPQRVVLQHDQKYLWVGNDSREANESGVTVIDADALRTLKFIPTGPGHHEIALSADDRYAFVSNRDGSSVTVIDVQTLEKVKDIETGPQPIALAYSSASGSLYVANGDSGEILVVDGRALEVTDRIRAGRGLGPLRFSQDGRWGVAVNPPKDEVYVIDTSNNRVLHTLAMDGSPFQVVFSQRFAYVRGLETEQVRMISLSQLGKGNAPLVTSFAAGQAPPGKVRDLIVADTMMPAPGEAAMLLTSPGDLTVYYYMEGMNAATGNFRNYGHAPRAVSVVDRTLKEREPGVYSAKVKIPVAGKYDVALLLDAPRMLNCFEVTAKPNPMLKPQFDPLAVEYLLKDRNVKVGKRAPFRFRLTDPATEKPRADLKDVNVLYYAASGRGRTVSPAKRVGDGIYEAELSIKLPEAYYVWVGSESAETPFEKLPYFSVRGVR